VVDEVDGDLVQRRILAWTGPSGPGKSTLLVAGEPTAGLDADTDWLVLHALRAEARFGAAVVLATHDPEVTALCDAQLHLRDGRVVASSVG
jgi:ABC-type lipoprotein export system ATPase subunit